MASSAAISIPRKKDQMMGALASSGSSSPASSSSSTASPSPSPTPLFHHRRRPSLLSSSVSRVEHSVFDLGTRDGSPRLITCVKASQGFEWSLDIFLPSSCDISVQSLADRSMEPVHEIVLTEEEYARMLPS